MKAMTVIYGAVELLPIVVMVYSWITAQAAATTNWPTTIVGAVWCLGFAWLAYTESQKPEQ